jgi:hypothetical protein
MAFTRPPALSETITSNRLCPNPRCFRSDKNPHHHDSDSLYPLPETPIAPGCHQGGPPRPPAIGPITASTFIATIDDPCRFDTGDQVACYLGLVPREYQSGETHFRGRITKEGDRLLRSLLVESATMLLERVKRRSRLKPVEGRAFDRDWG